MATVLVTGGTGMIGKVLIQQLLHRNYKVIVLTRGHDAKKLPDAGLTYAQWDIGKQTIDKEAISSADHIIHLAGAGVADKRWTAKRKQEIVDSRVKSGQLLLEALKENTHTIKTVVTASAIGWYGPDPVIPNPRPFTEEAPSAPGFLGETCQQWESSLEPVTTMGIRYVRLRTGIVLSRKGGALEEFKKPLHFGVATILGSGKQVVSWIHIDDLVSLYINTIENEKMTGAYNAVAPSPVTNRELVSGLAKSGKRFYIPVKVPVIVLKALLGEMSIEVLKSATVSGEKALKTGFIFRYSTLPEALNDLS